MCISDSYLYLPDGQLFYTNSGEGERQGPVGEVRQKAPSAGYVKWKGNPYYYIRYVSDTSHMTVSDTHLMYTIFKIPSLVLCRTESGIWMTT